VQADPAQLLLHGDLLPYPMLVRHVRDGLLAVREGADPAVARGEGGSGRGGAFEAHAQQGLLPNRAPVRPAPLVFRVEVPGVCQAVGAEVHGPGVAGRGDGALRGGRAAQDGEQERGERGAQEGGGHAERPVVEMRS
jgi:hypothetical protein